MITVVTVQLGDEAYEDLIGPLRRDATLLARMWVDAESRLDEAPGKRWCVAVVDGIAAAWAACYVDGDTLVCCNSYERPGYRNRGWYASAYRHRQTTIVETEGRPAVTYVFEQPLALHLRDGWVVTGEGVSNEPDAPPHRWFEMRRPESCNVA